MVCDEVKRPATHYAVFKRLCLGALLKRKRTPRVPTIGSESKFVLAPDGDYSLDVGKTMPSKTDDVRLVSALSGGLGSFEFIFDDDDVIQLLRTAIEREGSQMAFAKRHDINRTYLNMVLSGKRSVGDSVAEALGLHKVYKAK
jgi:hypothetical protein